MFLSILPSSDTHNKQSKFIISSSIYFHSQNLTKHSINQYYFVSILHYQDPHNKHGNIPNRYLYILPKQALTTNTLTFNISFSLYIAGQTIKSNKVIFNIISPLFSLLPHPHNKHGNIRYFLYLICTAPDPQRKRVNFSVFFPTLPSPELHIKHSNIQLPFLSTLPSASPSQQTQ